jgi:hypothetical protein
MKMPWDAPKIPNERVASEEERALAHYQRDVGANYDAGFGSLLDDVPAADIDRVLHDHPSHED